jgi:hypothetical protein
VDPLAVVVNRDRQLLLGRFLPDDVLIEEFLDFEGLGELVRAGGWGFGAVVFEDGVADRNALVTYVCPRIVARGRN